MPDWVDLATKGLENAKDFISPNFSPKSNADRDRYRGYEAAAKGGYLDEYEDQNYIHNLWRLAQEKVDGSVEAYTKAHEDFERSRDVLKERYGVLERSRGRIHGPFKRLNGRYGELTDEMNILSDQIVAMNAAEYSWKINTLGDRNKEGRTRKLITVAAGLGVGSYLAYRKRAPIIAGYRALQARYPWLPF